MKTDSRKKVSIGLFLILFLTACLVVTTFALVFYTARVEDNVFMTGGIRINLNDGKPVFDNLTTAPGETLEETFFLKNDSSTSVICKVYGKEIKGELAELLDVSLYAVEYGAGGAEETRTLLFEGKLSKLIKDNAPRLPEPVGVGETQFFAMQIHFPEENGIQTGDVTFDLEALAVQAKNNPDGKFE